MDKAVTLATRPKEVTLSWDVENPAEIETARGNFGELVTLGYTGYALAKGDNLKGEQIQEFNPKAERILMIRPLAGG